MALPIKSVAECPRQDVYLHIEKPEKENKLSPTMQKVMRVAAIILICLGVALILGGASFFGLGAPLGLAVALAAAQGIITLGIGSLIGGCQMLNMAEKGKTPKETRVSIGGVSLEY